MVSWMRVIKLGVGSSLITLDAGRRVHLVFIS